MTPYKYDDPKLARQSTDSVWWHLQDRGIPAHIRPKRNGMIRLQALIDPEMDHYVDLFTVQQSNGLTFITHLPRCTTHTNVRDGYIEELIDLATEAYHTKLRLYNERKNDPDVPEGSLVDLQRKFPHYETHLYQVKSGEIRFYIREDYGTVRDIMAVIYAAKIQIIDPDVRPRSAESLRVLYLGFSQEVADSGDSISYEARTNSATMVRILTALKESGIRPDACVRFDGSVLQK